MKTVMASMNSDSCFMDGLYRVARPVQLNPNYREILGSRVDEFHNKYGTCAMGKAVAADEAIAILDRFLDQKFIVDHLVPPRVALAFGKTQNNLREFEFLRELLARHGLENEIFNTGLVPPQLTDHRVVDEEQVLGHVRQELRAYLDEQQTLAKPVLLQLANYTQAYMSWQRAFRKPPAALPRLLVFANDHSPAQVACSMAAKEKGIPRVYIQHAEVSEMFPPLDFEVSILRNEASREVYRSIGPVTGEAFAVSRESRAFVMPEVNAIDGKHAVGVYLTSQVKWEGVRDVLQALERNPMLGRLFVKPHPSTPLNRIRRECPDIEVIRDVPGFLHLAVVANSSVVIELIHAGIPVFQYFGMDSVPPDYYGFSRQGICPALLLGELSGPFWEAFKPDSAWLSAFRRYDPAATADGLQEEQHAIELLGQWFGSRSAVSGSKEKTADTSDGGLVTVDEGVAEIRKRFGRDVLSCMPYSMFDYLVNRTCQAGEDRIAFELSLVESMKGLFSERDPAAFRAFAASSQIPLAGSKFLHWLKRRDIELTGRAMTQTELSEIIEYALRDEHELNLRKRLEIGVLLFLVRLDRSEEVGSFLERAKCIRFDQLHINNRIALMRWIRKSPAHNAALNIDVALLYQRLSPFHRLKLRVLTASEEIFALEKWNHESIERGFMKSAPVELTRSYREFVEPVYSQLRDRMLYMDVRWSKSQQDALYGKIEYALVAREPFSLVRLGDGEGYMFYGDDQLFTEHHSRNRELHWWGEVLPTNLRCKIIPSIREAAAEADVLGIPSIYRFLRDNSDRSTSLIGGTTSRGLVEVLRGVEKIRKPGQVFTEDRANLSLFSSLPMLKRLFPLSRKVVVIGSADETEVRKVFKGVAEFRYLVVPTHNRTTRNNKYNSSGRSLPYVYEELRRDVADAVGAGDLVLVAAGIVGKIFINDARKAGGVALDVGSSLDEWVNAGIHSLH